MTAFVVLVLVVLALSVVLLGRAVWMAVRAMRRLGRSTRQRVERGILSVKAHALPPGQCRQVAGMRLELRAGIDQTRRILDDATGRNYPLGELPSLFRRLEHLAASVDVELRILEGEPGRVEAAPLAAIRRRSQDVVAAAATIRRAVGDVHAGLNDDGFELLHHEVDLEVSALRAGIAAAGGAAASVLQHERPQELHLERCRLVSPDRTP